MSDFANTVIDTDGLASLGPGPSAGVALAFSALAGPTTTVTLDRIGVASTSRAGVGAAEGPMIASLGVDS